LSKHGLVMVDVCPLEPPPTEPSQPPGPPPPVLPVPEPLTVEMLVLGLASVIVIVKLRRD